jgi:hypothetical protein
MVDRVEQQRRGQSPRKTSTTHPYVAIEHRVLDSAAFADLKPTAKVLIFVLARQLTKDSNGRLQATFSWCKKYGIGSEHTLKDSVAQLISHGFLYRTRSHGANGTWATYALTWLPISKKEGLFLSGFVPMAYRNWQPADKKSSPQKVQDTPSRKCSFTPEFPAESAGKPTAESADYESMLPCYSGETALSTVGHAVKYRAASYESPSLIRRQTTADRGQLRVLH